MRNTKSIIWVTLGLLFLLSLGCSGFSVSLKTVDIGELQTRSHTFEYEDAEEVRAFIKMGSGQLNVNSGANTLMEGDFTFNVEDWEPEVQYNVNEGKGRLDLRQPNINDFSFDDDVRYEWDLRFGDQVPLRFEVDMGAGQGDLDLGRLNVTRLDMRAGAGDVRLDLSGNDTLTYLEFDMGAGDLTLDLTGDWEEDVDVVLNGAVGQITVHLPDDIGVIVDVNKGVGNIEAGSLQQRGSSYVNAVYDEADVVVRVNIRSGLGQVNLIVD